MNGIRATELLLCWDSASAGEAFHVREVKAGLAAPGFAAGADLAPKRLYFEIVLGCRERADIPVEDVIKDQAGRLRQQEASCLRTAAETQPADRSEMLVQQKREPIDHAGLD